MDYNRLFLRYFAQSCQEMGVHIKVGKMSYFPTLSAITNRPENVVFIISSSDDFDFIKYNNINNPDFINNLPNCTADDLKNVPDELLNYNPLNQTQLHIEVDEKTGVFLLVKSLSYLLDRKIPRKEFQNIRTIQQNRSFSENRRICYLLRNAREAWPESKEILNLCNKIITQLPLELKNGYFDDVIYTTIKINTHNGLLNVPEFEKTILKLWEHFDKTFSELKNQKSFIQTIKSLKVDAAFLESKLNLDPKSVDIFAKPEIPIEYIFVNPRKLMEKYDLPKSQNMPSITTANYEGYLLNIISFLNKPKNKQPIGFSQAITQEIHENGDKIIMIGFLRPTRKVEPIVSNIILKSFEFLSSCSDNIPKNELKNMSSFDFKNLLKEEINTIIKHSLVSHEISSIEIENKEISRKNLKI